jgi:hypothetical protein
VPVALFAIFSRKIIVPAIDGRLLSGNIQNKVFRAYFRMPSEGGCWAGLKARFVSEPFELVSGLCALCKT